MASFPLPDIKCGSSLLQWELCESTPAPYLGPPFLKIYLWTSYFPDSIVCEESTHNNLGPHDYFIRPVDFVHLRQVDPDFVGWKEWEQTCFFLEKKGSSTLEWSNAFYTSPFFRESWEIHHQWWSLWQDFLHSSWDGTGVHPSVWQVEGANSELIYEAGQNPQGGDRWGRRPFLTCLVPCVFGGCMTEEMFDPWHLCNIYSPMPECAVVLQIGSRAHGRRWTQVK